jgi:hypothetical protein
MRGRAFVTVAMFATMIVGACDRSKPSEAATTSSASSTGASSTSSAAPTASIDAASVDLFAQPSTSESAPDPMTPYLQKPMVKISHLGPMEIETRADKHVYARVSYHLEVLAKGPPKAAVAARARCRIGDEEMVDDSQRFDELDRLAPGESMALYADFFSYPPVDQAPRRCSIVFSYQPVGRYTRDPHAPVAAFCVDTEKVVDGECKE